MIIVLYFQKGVDKSFYLSFNGIRYCDLFVQEDFLVQVMTCNDLVYACSANKQARSFRVHTRKHIKYLNNQ